VSLIEKRGGSRIGGRGEEKKRGESRDSSRVCPALAFFTAAKVLERWGGGKSRPNLPPRREEGKKEKGMGRDVRSLALLHRRKREKGRRFFYPHTRLLVAVKGGRKNEEKKPPKSSVQG